MELSALWHEGYDFIDYDFLEFYDHMQHIPLPALYHLWNQEALKDRIEELEAYKPRVLRQAKLFLRYYFMELGYQKVTANVYSFNESSLKLHERLGFIREGQLRNMIYCNGKYHDEIYLGMTKLEFEMKYQDFLLRT